MSVTAMGKQTASVDSQVVARIRQRGPGTIFTLADFADLGPRNAVDLALSRNARSGAIRKLARGVYDLPRRDARFTEAAANGVAPHLAEHLDLAFGGPEVERRPQRAQVVMVVDAPDRIRSPVVVPRADDSLQFRIDGPGEIVATDNGDPTSFESFQSHARKAFNGLALVIVRARPRRTGTIRLSAEAGSIAQGTLALRSVAGR